MADSTAAWTKESLLKERKTVIGPNCALNYSRKPLYITRGRAQWLYEAASHADHTRVGDQGHAGGDGLAADAAGAVDCDCEARGSGGGSPATDPCAYLDCVNNVCHVGHCHPHVVQAGCDQLATLNTNSRYLSPFIVEAAKRLTATMPEPLRVVYWVNSGSEANDLALRLARAHTRKRGVICVDGAYHGHLTSIIDISPYKFAREGGKGQRSWVRTAAIPDVFSGMVRGRLSDEACGEAYAKDVQRCIDSLAEAEAREAVRRGTDPDFDDDGLTAGVGAFIMESILSCGGQVVPPAGYLRRVYAAVRAAGAVCIADEVQVGFGRVGEKFWAFQLQGDDVVPDIVTLGKPMGNGFPVAAVVTTPEIARSFDNGMEYFNTYGGNPVAGRIACAVMDVIESEGLQKHALEVGKVLLAGFERLYEKFTIIGSVRGIGLMVGLEIVRDRREMKEDGVTAKQEPWAEGASAVVYAMRDRRILLSTDGMDNNVIKLKPPMVFSAEDAERVVRELDDVMSCVDKAVAAYRALAPAAAPSHH